MAFDDMRAEFKQKRLDQWAYWITEREHIRRMREAGEPAPWTRDPAMAGTRYCNVRRMDDKVSKWLLANWYPAGATPRSYLLAALLARMINRPETLAHMTDGEPFRRYKPVQFHKRMYEMKATGAPVFTNAYIINGASGGPKIEQVLNAITIASDMAEDDDATAFIEPKSLEVTAGRLHALPGVGSFIAGQVVADLRQVMRYKGWWLDRMDWAPVGPGSNRGMRYLLGVYGPEDLAGRGGEMHQKVFTIKLQELVGIAKAHKEVGPVFADRKLEAHDIQNTLCELSKYIRVKNGGHAKNKFSQVEAATRDSQGALL
jgi:alpha-glutamyl/putrescinyl thymine pyrophosphorylase clade 1